MKKSILAIAILIGLAACKKSSTSSDFVATDVTGTLVLKGNLSRNVIVPNGNTSWSNSGKRPAAGINVVVKVNKADLYQSASVQGADLYYGKSDSLGNYIVTVRSNAIGVNAEISFDGFTSTLDTIINNQARKGAYASFLGNNFTKTLVMGQNAQVDYNYFGSPLASNGANNLKTGTAIVTGNVYINTLKQVLSGTLTTLSTVSMGVLNRKVYLNFSNDPSTYSSRSYETTTDGNGAYTFTLNTVEQGSAGYNQIANIWVNDYAATRDTIKPNNSIVPGKSGVFQKVNTSQSSLYNGSIRNAVNLTYNVFVPN
ncbi:MAG: hypothetical protein WCR21_12780 [Bacteroidota bacterium]